MTADPLLGQTIGNYRIERVLGHGGMGNIYVGVHLALGRSGVIKLIREDHADAEFRARFRREARAASAEHDHIVRVYDFGEDRGRLYLAMELLDGSLSDLLRAWAGRPFPVELARELGRQVAEGLAYAHRYIAVHRDIKPANLLYRGPPPTALATAGYTVKVSDFGLARLREGTDVSVAGQLAGTLSYMAPEQLLGQELDGRCDLYSLGVVLYELVTGQRPFPIATLGDALRYHVQTSPPTPRALRPDLPADLETLILRCLAKRAEDRFATGADLARALVAPASPFYSVPPPEASEIRPEQADEQSRPPSETRLRVTLDQPVVTLTPGQTTRVGVTIANLGTTVAGGGLAVEGIPVSWVRVLDEPVELNPGEITTVGLAVTVPRSPAGRTGAYAVTVRAGAVTGSGRWTVAPFAASQLTLLPLRGRGRQHAAYRVQVANLGNAPAEYALSATGDEQALRYSFASPGVMVEPGETAEAALDVRAPRRWLGTTRVHRFAVRAVSRSGGDVPPPAQGEFAQRAMLPGWLLGLAALVLVGLAVVSGLLIAGQVTGQATATQPVTPPWTVIAGITPATTAPPTVTPRASAPAVVTTGPSRAPSVPPSVPPSAPPSVSPSAPPEPRADARLSTATLAFDAQEVGTSVKKSVTLTNAGNAVLRITEIALDPAQGGFTQAGTCQATLAVGATCSIEVTFTPQGSGASSARLIVRHSAASEALQVTLSGTGTLPGAFCASPGRVQESAKTGLVRPVITVLTSAVKVKASNGSTVTIEAGRGVLVVGGSFDDGTLPATARVYNPADGAWYSVTLNGAARQDHTVTALKSGEVLIVGGRDASKKVLDTAVRYDPATEQAASVKPLARASHTATALATGQVLVVGGVNATARDRSTQIYNPTANSWTPGPQLESAPTGHTATLLKDDRVLVVGGFDGTRALDTVLIFSADGKTVTKVAPLPKSPRRAHTATLLADGRVLVAGGLGRTSNDILASVVLYDPSANSWTEVAEMSTARIDQTATLLPDGRVLVAGGFDGTKVLETAELYDPQANRWVMTASMNTGRRFHAALLRSDNNVFIVGGANSSEAYRKSCSGREPAPLALAGSSEADRPRRFGE